MPKKLTDDDYKVMGLPARFHDVNWAFMIKHGLAPHFERYLENLRLARSKGVGIYIGGNPSTGKSYSAAVVAKAFRQNEFSVQWLDSTEAYDLLVWNRPHQDPEYETWQNRVQFVDLLIIDNLGSEKAINRKKILLEVLKKRSDAKQPTVITTHFNLKQLSELYEDSVEFLRESVKDVSLTKRIENQAIRKMIEETF